MKVLVLGGGVVGVAAAYYLSRDGHEVEIVERNDKAASETSYGNAGLVSPGDSYAWASPSALVVFIKSLYRRDLGIKVRFNLDPHFIAWSWKFLFECTHARARINTLRKLRLAFYSKTCINEIAEATKVAYDAGGKGILYFYRSQESLDAGAKHMQILADNGLTLEVIGRERLVELEPGLKAAAHEIAGAVYSPIDQTGDCCKFSRSLAAWCEQNLGARFHYGTTAIGIETDGDRVTTVLTDKGRHACDAIVIALGPETPLLTRKLGLDVPIYPVKGYSATLPLSDPSRAPTMGGVDEDRLIAYSRLGERLRVASTAEFAGYDKSHRPSDFARLLATAEDLFPGAFDRAHAEYWAGFRPMTPASVPILGRARYANLFLDCGHGHVGWTMACGSGKFVADLVSGRKPEIDTDGLLYVN
ncbi:FAD-dependent oxidoreductase [Nordella sp. HKS 07]|uniref:D-amino acid dehydrogenase n=1 Tax=Nordella sp. HKS 07 TaxID=2712222 RepID=UPI0013E173C1|nr:D-amino acid dehydrogenase [Nordella sp. HKS 07]QIG47974.1 FAD-dependent oxidoreductase [Nordella sp. HKS 07]